MILKGEREGERERGREGEREGGRERKREGGRGRERERERDKRVSTEGQDCCTWALIEGITSNTLIAIMAAAPVATVASIKMT